MEEGWVNDIAAVMQQVVETQLPEMEKDLRQQLASERVGRDEYAIENHRLRGEMARVEAENATLKTLTAPPLDEIAAILYPSASRGRRGFAKAVNTVADWLDVVAPESVSESAEQAITEPTLVIDAILADREQNAVDQATEGEASETVAVSETSAASETVVN